MKIIVIKHSETKFLHFIIPQVDLSLKVNLAVERQQTTPMNKRLHRHSWLERETKYGTWIWLDFNGQFTPY